MDALAPRRGLHYNERPASQLLDLEKADGPRLANPSRSELVWVVIVVLLSADMLVDPFRRIRSVCRHDTTRELPDGLDLQYNKPDKNPDRYRSQPVSQQRLD